MSYLFIFLCGRKERVVKGRQGVGGAGEKRRALA